MPRCCRGDWQCWWAGLRGPWGSACCHGQAAWLRAPDPFQVPPPEAKLLAESWSVPWGGTSQIPVSDAVTESQVPSQCSFVTGARIKHDSSLNVRQEGLGHVHGGPFLLRGMTHRGLGIAVLCSMRMEPRECWALCVCRSPTWPVLGQDRAHGRSGNAYRLSEQTHWYGKVSRPRWRELCQFQKDTRDLWPQPWHDWHLGQMTLCGGA